MNTSEQTQKRAMAAAVTQTHGSVLELGFGMGISATAIQEAGVRSHTVVECHEEVIRAFERWRQEYRNREIRLLQGTWQEMADRLGQYDGILFDTYPTNEEEFQRYVIDGATFAEPFFSVAARCLRPGGVFTYYTNEIDSFSRRHQRLLFRHFRTITLQVVRPLAPPKDCHYWWADAMVVVRAER
jgi:spermidine synthase